ncbi:MAG TPA: aldo/keto reductase [Treponemataceae bacterium]|nr:aldo/keto reductase [Treponemataceae bacterium]
MEYISFGKTGLMVSRTAFGALPIQRIASVEEAATLLRTAWDGGVNFFDTARAYSDSEEKLGFALDEIRKDVIVATKTGARTGADLFKDLETSLRNLQTDWIDVYQLHNPSFIPLPGGEDGLYDALAKAREEGKIRFFGVTNHSRQLALQAAESGLYDSIQFPLSYLSAPEDVELAALCEEKQVGFLAMKALAGGLLTNARSAFAWMRKQENVVPLWGIQKTSELEEFLALEREPPVLDDELSAMIEKDRAELAGNFCRGCGYCLPCPANIPINNANRMRELLRRSPPAQWLTPEWRELMSRIEDCTKCGLCAKRCPYGLKPYETLPAHLADYRSFLPE